jgi:hypothetical protein
MQRLQALAGQYEIRPDWVMKLRQLESFDVCVICDDSGSMSTVSVGGGGGGPRAANPYAPMPTRWTELQGTLSTLLPLATALNPSIDVYFLNRPPLLGVSDPNQVAVAFQSPPSGFTPLSKAFRYIMAAKQAVLAEKKLLLLIFTDGQPTDDHGRTDIRTFLNDLASKPPSVFVSMIACTDDEQAVEWMNEADERIPNVDTSDDYASERAEILQAQGPRFPFSFGDYLTKCLLGPIDPTFDSLDVRTGGAGRQNKKGGCSIA